MTQRQSLPTTASFRPEVIDQYVRDKILKGNFVTWLVPVAGLLAAGGGYAVIQLVEVWMILVAGGGVLAGGASLLRDLSPKGKERIRSSYLQEASRLVEAQADQLEEWLIQEFTAFESERGSALVERLRRHMAQLEDVLDDKFEPSDSTHSQFHGTAETLRVGILNTLKDAVTTMKANAAIDVDYNKRQVQRTSGADRENHERKLAIYEQGQARVAEQLSAAEHAITGLTELVHKVAEIRSGDAENLQDFIDDVQGLAQRASAYVDERSI